MVRQVRTDAGLSVRALAAEAAVSASTISRIEMGEVDPTVGTLAQIVAATGRQLRLTAPRSGPDDAALRRLRPRLADLAEAWHRGADGDQPDWTRFRLVLDELRLYPDWVPGAIRKRPTASGSPVIDTLLAGVAEFLADRLGHPRPAWTSSVPGLDDEWVMPGTPAMLAKRRGTTPEQLLARGLVIDEGSLWRNGVVVS